MKVSNLFVVFYLLCIGHALAQEETDFSDNLIFKNFSTKEGLSQRSVTSIIQDNSGFIWIGTRYGLNKFDGITFKNYNFNSEDSKSISHNWITKLKKDNHNNIWVATRKGLNKYIPETDNFERVVKTNSNKPFYREEIWDIEAQDTNYLWIATNNGLDKLNITTKNILSFNHNKNISNSISSNKIRGLLVTSHNNTLWISTTEKIDLYNADQNSFKHFDYPNKSTPDRTKNHTITLFEDSKGKIWLGYNDGLAFFNPKTNVFEDFRLNNKILINSSVRSIYEDKEGNLWIGTYQGLRKLDKQKKNLYEYRNDIKSSRSLSQNSIYKIYEDSRGDMWIGTWAGGLNYYSKSSNNFTTFLEGSTSKGLNYKVVSSIVEEEENLWIGTEGGGINFYDKKSKSFTYYKHNPNDNNSLSDNNVKAIIKDSKGNFWIGTHGGGLNKLVINDTKKTFTRYKNDPNNLNSISDNKITALIEDDLSNIWIGTNEGGLNYYSIEEDRFIRVIDNKNSIGNFIYTIFKSTHNNNNNRLYIGTEKGLFEINTKTKKNDPINFRNIVSDDFITNPIISIYEESASSLWIGTEGEGLYNYNISTSKAVRYGLTDGLPNEVIYGIISDENHHIWLSTNKGLSRLNLETKTFKNFQETDGIQGDEFNYGAYLLTKKGNLIFGGANGFTVFDPKEIKTDSFLPPIEITSFKVRNEPFKIRLDSSKSITLDHNQNDFSFDFVALSYSQPNKNEYAYILEGFDSEWNFVGNNRTATYTNLNSGDYTFKIKATNSDGIWNENGPIVHLKIQPQFWNTWLAYLLYIISAITIFWLIKKYSLLRIQDKNQLKQERLDKEQMQEVNKLKLQLFTNISHDFRTPLTLIIGPLKKMIQEKVGEESIQNQLNGMYRNASILLQLINQLLDFRKSEAGKLHLHASNNDIVSFVKNIQLSFDELAKEKKIEYTLIASEDSKEVWFDKIEMKKVILNILSNAFKFTPNEGKISIKISTHILPYKKAPSTYVKIEIIDSGKGIEEKDLEYVFDRYFQLGQQNELRSGTGVGLALAKDIVELHQGEIYVESILGKGSCFIILLPLGNSHLLPKQIVDVDYDNDDILDYNGVAMVQSGWLKKEKVNPTQIKFNDQLPTILIVEDNIEVRQFIKEIFEIEFNIFEAENGQSGIDSAEQNPIDVIVSDVMMPEMDGLEMSHKIKTNIKTSHIPIILLTARTSSKMQNMGYKTGADIYLTKPFDGSTLKLQVNNILKSRQNLIDKFKKDILLAPKEIAVVSTDEIFLKKAMQVIEDNFSDSEFNVNSFIEKMYMSQSILYRKIKVLTGQSISEFIRAIRLKKASQLLTQTNINIADVAYDIGFNDLKYFRKCFKKTFNQTPSQYRKEKQHLRK